MSKICILYGFCEGTRIGRRFERALKAEGHTVIRDPSEADIIFTHSGGYLLMPDEIRAKRIIHIAPYHWPGRSWFACGGRKFIDDIRAHHKEGEWAFWARKSLWNFLYLWRMPTNFRMAKNVGSDRKWRFGGLAVIARPRFDAFCTPDPKLLPFTPDSAYISLPGYHDDCWRDPKPYLLLMKTGKI